MKTRCAGFFAFGVGYEQLFGERWAREWRGKVLLVRCWRGVGAGKRPIGLVLMWGKSVLSCSG